MKNEEIAAAIDHAVLKPNTTTHDLFKGAKLCIKYQVASMCVRPCDVKLAYTYLNDTNINVSTVIGFPHGSNCTQIKVAEAKLAIEHSADELDVIINIGRLLDGEYSYVLDDLRAVVNAIKPHFVKAILEVCYLSPSMIFTVCQLAKAAGATFVKTSTGFGPSGATPKDVAAMLEASGTAMGVKASGGIKTRSSAVAYIRQGCTRLGTSHTATILEEK